MKSYTDLEQSKKLAEILPLESADMHYNDWIFDFYDGYEHTGRYTADLGTPRTICAELDIPCWSLAALFKMLPHSARLERGSSTELYSVTLPNELESSDWYIEPIDACYELILKLNEFKML